MKFNNYVALKGFLFRSIPIHIIELLLAILPNNVITNKIRGFLIRPFIKKCGKNFMMAKGCVIIRPENMYIGNNVYIAHNVWINASGVLEIGNNTIIGPKCVLATSKHKDDEHGYTTHTGILNKIVIKEGVWLAANVVVTDGVIINNGVTVGANAVVTHDLPSFVLAGGIPAKVIKEKNVKQSNFH